MNNDGTLKYEKSYVYWNSDPEQITLNISTLIPLFTTLYESFLQQYEKDSIVIYRERVESINEKTDKLETVFFNEIKIPPDPPSFEDFIKWLK